jgi:hypothetical protein
VVVKHQEDRESLLLLKSDHLVSYLITPKVDLVYLWFQVNVQIPFLLVLLDLNYLYTESAQFPERELDVIV